MALWPTQRPVLWISGDRSLGVKWLMQEADHSPPSSAEGKNEWSYEPLLLYAFMACTGTT